MDCKLFPLAKASVFDQEISRKILVSSQRLFDNIEALLVRDKRDCLSKQLGGLLTRNATIYQVRSEFQGKIQQKLNKIVCVRELREMANCNNVEENFTRNSSLGEEMKTALTLTNKSDHSHCDGSTKDGVHSKALLRSVRRREASSPTHSSGETLSDKEKKLPAIKFSSEEIDCKGDALPGNGWWNEQDSSVSESECDESSDIEAKTDEFAQSLMMCQSHGRHLTSSCGNDLAETLNDCCNLGNGQRQASFSCKSDVFDVFQLTSAKTCATEKTRNDKSCQAHSEDKAPFFRHSNAVQGPDSDQIKFDDELPISLTCEELLRYDAQRTSRVSRNKVQELGNIKNYEVHWRGNDETKSCARRLESNKVFPKMTMNKINKITPEKTVNTVERYSRNVNSPVKLKLKNRSKCSDKFNGQVEISSNDERMLPTTLHLTADASYSIMSPYMASVVWSVMEDEKV
ncbi:uncharacterized protein [Montipora capricornis]|uniref:uncharacterized protein n=1 Tax=Montipora capricornis TaxID=246305 RepID=UPI0035F1DC38